MKEIIIKEKIWGDEQWIVNADYCGKILRLKKNYFCSLHFHKIKMETFLIMDGSVFLIKDNKEYVLKKGDVVDIPIGCVHRLYAIEDSVILEFSTHHEDADSYREEVGGEISEEKKTYIKSFIYDNDNNDNVAKVDMGIKNE